MSENIPFWYKMIYFWCYKMNRYGLTIPFILGVQSINEFQEINEYKIDIDTLFDEMQNYNAEKKVMIRYCYDLNEYVLDLHHNNIPEQSLKKEGNLIIEDDVLEKFSSINEIKFFFKKEYEENISLEMFSRTKTKEWQFYDDNDIKNINKFLL